MVDHLVDAEVYQAEVAKVEVVRSALSFVGLNDGKYLLLVEFSYSLSVFLLLLAGGNLLVAEKTKHGVFETLGPHEIHLDLVLQSPAFEIMSVTDVDDVGDHRKVACHYEVIML